MATQAWPWHPARPWHPIVLLIVMCTGVLAEESTTSARLLLPVDGPPVEARLVGATDQWQWTFAGDDRRWTLPAGDVVRWGAPTAPGRGPIVVMADGGLLRAEEFRFVAGQVELHDASLSTGARHGPLRIALSRLAGVILAWPSDREARDRLVDRVLRADGATDRLMLTNGDRLDGIVAGIDDRHVLWDSDGRQSEFPRDRVAAVVLNPALRAKPAESGLRTWVGLDDGTRVLAGSLTVAGGVLRLRLAGASDDSSLWHAPAERCVFLQPIDGRALYLSDRSDDGYRHVPFLELPWDYRRDRNALGGRLRAGGREYLKGLGMHSSARVTYLLDEPADRFEAELALDDAAGRGGSVRYHVFVDRRRQFSSEPIRGGDAPKTVRADLTGAKRLDLIIDFGEGADQLDYANWLDARLIRAKKPSGGTKAE